MGSKRSSGFRTQVGVGMIVVGMWMILSISEYLGGKPRFATVYLSISGLAAFVFIHVLQQEAEVGGDE